jgi:hypothetical protein
MSESGSEAPAPIVTPADPLALEEKSALAADAGAPTVAAAAEDAEPEARADLRLFFGPNAEAFLAAIERRKAGHWFVGPCWSGFFFPAAWFLYRKLYGWAAICCIVPILSTALNLGEFGRVLLGAPSFLGLLGPRLYVPAAQRSIAQIRAASQSEEEARATIGRAGGVSIAGAVVGALLASISIVVAFIVGLRAGLGSVHLQLH